MRNDSFKNGPVNASTPTADDHITRESAVKSEWIIIYRRVFVNCQIMMLVIIVDKLIAELQRRRHVIGMDTVR